MDDIDNHRGSVSRSFSQKPYSLNHNPNASSSNSIPRRFHSGDPQFPRHEPVIYLDDDDDDEGEDQEEDMDSGDGEEDFYRHPKKRRLRSLNSSFELAARVSNGTDEKSSGKGRGFPVSEEEWSERGVYVLLEVWGERYLELGRRSLRAEDWREVAERVSEVSGIERTEAQCRNTMDLLKRKYKKEKAKMEQLPGPKSGPRAATSRWGYFRKMDALLAPPQASRQASGLACGFDSGEFVFSNPRVYLEQSNGQDEMRDSPAESEDENGSDSDGSPRGRARGDGRSMAMLADSIQKFGAIYGKIESDKRQQMMELEKMRRDFCRDLELQKKQIMERTQAELAKIRAEEEEEEDDDGDDDDVAGSAEDLSE